MNSLMQQEIARGRINVAVDRRRNDRLATRVPVQITASASSSRPCDGVCTDLSVGGAGIDTEALLQVGEIIDFKFVETEEVSLSYRARIIYRLANHYGVYFLSAE